MDSETCPLHGRHSTHADDGPSERLALEAMEHESVVAEVLRLRAELSSVSARASEVPGLSAELDRLRWELAVAMGEKTAGAQCLAEFERMAVECTELLMRKIDTALTLEEAMRVGLEECESLRAQLASVTAERDRLQRACDEGLPREVIPCPSCKAPHVEGPRHDDPAKDGRVRPHHTHRCYLCGHIWDAGRWTFGVELGGENEVTKRLRAEGRAEGLREALAIALAEEGAQAQASDRRVLAYEDVQRAQARRFEAEVIGDRIKAAMEVSRG